MRFNFGLLILAVHLLQPLVAQSPEALLSLEGRTIAKLEVVADGPLNRISHADLLKLFELHEGEPFTTSRSRATIEQLHATGLFYDVHVRANPLQNGSLEVVVALVRRYLVGRVRFEGDVELSERRLRPELAFREGEAYSNELLEATLGRLVELYQNSGYYQARIGSSFEKDVEDATLEVIFEIEAGSQATVGTLNIETEGDVVRPEELRSLIQLEPGSDYSTETKDQDLDTIERFLALQGYFRADVYVRDGPQYSPQVNQVSLTYRVVPREKIEVRFSGIDLSDEQKSALPLYAATGPVQAFLEETANILRRNLQEDGYFLAEVDVNTQGEVGDPDLITFEVRKGPQGRLEEIRIEGNQNVETKRLKRLIQASEAGFFSDGEASNEILQQDRQNIQFLYQNQGYRDVEVTTEFTQQSSDFVLTYRINEGQRYFVNSLDLVGQEQVASDVLLEEIQLQPGRHFSPLALAQDRANVLAVYENLGFRNVEFRSRVDFPQTGRVDVVYTLREGQRFFTEAVVITGNEQTKRSVIEREVLLEPGTPLSLDRMLQSETNLYNLAIFNRVNVIDIPKFDDPDTRIVLIALEEAQRYTIFYGIGYSESFGDAASEGVRGTFGITDNNFLGRARSLSLGTRVGQLRQRANLSHTIPYPFNYDLPTVLSVTVDNEERVTGAEDENILSRRIRGRPFDSFRAIFSSQSERTLSRRESLFFRYTFEQVRIDVPEELQIPLEFFREEERLRLAKFALSYLNESRNEPTNPTQGFFLNGEASLAAKPFGSQREFFRFLANGQYYFPLSSETVLAASLRIGAIRAFGFDEDISISNPVPISERFFAGGPTTLRGLPRDLAGPLLRDENGEIIPVNRGSEDNPTAVPLGGNALILANLELRFPILGPVGGALFYDVGNVFRRITNLNAGFSNAVGLGFSFSTPVGPVRFDIAYNPNPPDVVGFDHWNFHINLGQPF